MSGRKPSLATSLEGQISASLIEAGRSASEVRKVQNALRRRIEPEPRRQDAECCGMDFLGRIGSGDKKGITQVEHGPKRHAQIDFSVEGLGLLLDPFVSRGWMWLSEITILNGSEANRSEASKV